MPQVHIVDKRISLEELAVRLLRPRARAAARRTTMDAILAANPGLDAARIDRGTVVFIPTRTPDVRVDDGPVNETVADLLARVRTGLDALAAAAVTGQESRVADKLVTQRALNRAAIRRAADASTRVADSVGTIRANLKDADAEGRRTATRMDAAQKRWDGELDALAALLRGQ